MHNISNIGSLFLQIGALLMVVGLLMHFFPTLKVPGDIVIQKKHFTFYFPWATCLAISIIVSILFYLFRKG